MYCFVEFFHDLIPKGRKTFEPSVVLLGKHIDNLQENTVILLGLVLGELS